jgi:hypothetical protein
VQSLLPAIRTSDPPRAPGLPDWFGARPSLGRALARLAVPSGRSLLTPSRRASGCDPWSRRHRGSARVRYRCLASCTWLGRRRRAGATVRDTRARALRPVPCDGGAVDNSGVWADVAISHHRLCRQVLATPRTAPPSGSVADSTSSWDMMRVTLARQFTTAQAGPPR